MVEMRLTTTAVGGRYKWTVVGLLWFVCLFNYADRQAIFSVFPLLKAEMHLSDVQLGYVASSFMWVYAAAAPFAGMVGDRFRRKHVILGGLIFWSLITVATALSTRYWHLVVFRALEGLGEAFYFPASMSLISAWHGKETRSRAMSWHQSSVYAGTITGGAVAGYLAQHYGWRLGFYVFGSLGVVLGIVLMFLLKEPETVDVREETFRFSGAWLEVFRNPMAVALMAVFICANFVAMVFLTWLPSYLTRTFHMSLTMAGFSATAYLQAASVLGVLTGGMVADGWVRKDRRGRMWTQAVGIVRGRALSAAHRVDVQRDGVCVRHHGVRLLQRHVRRQHLGIAARCGAAGAARDRGRRDEFHRLAGRRRGAGRDGVGVGRVGNGHVPERDVGGLRGGGFAAGVGRVALDDAKGGGKSCCVKMDASATAAARNCRLSAKLGQQTMSKEEAREYGSTAEENADGTVTIDLCLACRIRRAEIRKGR